jgi:hypothetical protein
MELIQEESKGLNFNEKARNATNSADLAEIS